MILLDTHVLVWLADDAPRLGRLTRRRIDRAVAGEGVGISSISFWEIATLVERGRLRQRVPPEEFRARCAAMAIQEIPVDGSIVITAARLRSFHGDPADRLVGATALELSATLATADESLLDWKHGPKLLDATR